MIVAARKKYVPQKPDSEDSSRTVIVLNKVKGGGGPGFARLPRHPFTLSFSPPFGLL
jgi:hypothetical protein